MNKLLACMIFLTISLVSQNALAAQVQIEGGSTANCVGPAGISGITTPDEVITETGGYTTRDIVIPGTTIGTSAVFLDKENNIGYAQMESGSSAKDQTASSKTASSSSTAYNQYILTGQKWTTKNPQLGLSLYYLGQPTNLNLMNVQSDINNAAYVWDSATSQMLFGRTGTAVTSTKNAQFSFNTYDGLHEIGWTNLGTSRSSAIAQTSWRYYTASGSMIDADVGLNRQWTYGWTTGTTSSAVADVETIALHELGHVLGLGDIYGTSKAFDYTEIMNSYSGSHRYLGAGDILGIQKLYGA